MILLGIDTSCDDTSVAVLENDTVLSNVISSQDDIHREWGGVVPNLARRAHEENFEKVYRLALKRAGIEEHQLEAIAVTYGPGLAIALGVGIDMAKELSLRLKLPVYGINHMEGHLYSSLALSRNKQGTQFSTITFPALGVLVSGGHTEIILIKSFGQYELLGHTVDDAFGEAFDKVARMLGLGYPGGALLAKLAKEGNAAKYQFPLPMRLSGDLNVSYSGLKTATHRVLIDATKGNLENLTRQIIQDIAAGFQEAAVQSLLIKIEKALKQQPVQDILLGGGAASNLLLRQRLRKTAKKSQAQIHVPRTKKLCSDNGAMIALAAWLRIQHGEQPTSLENLERSPQLSLTAA